MNLPLASSQWGPPAVVGSPPALLWIQVLELDALNDRAGLIADDHFIQNQVSVAVVPEIVQKS